MTGMSDSTRPDQPVSNPYAPPARAEPADVAETSEPPSRRPRMTLGQKAILAIMVLVTAWCVLVVGAATYEVISIQPGDYGMHDDLFRRTYLIAGSTGALIGAASLIAAIRIYSGLRYGRIVAALVITAFIMVYVLRAV